MAIMTTIANTPVHVGDTIVVYYRVVEKEKVAGKTKKEVKIEQKERFQPYEGIIIGIGGRNENKSFVVRRIGVGSIGIERIFPVSSPWISKVVVKKKGQVRRSKLYYLRGKTGKQATAIAQRKESPTPHVKIAASA